MIVEVLLQTQSPDWKDRNRGFYRLIALGSGDPASVGPRLMDLLKKIPAREEHIKLALIELLERENELVGSSVKSGRRLGEDYTNYYGDVIAAVATLKDIRSMNALLGAITTGGMATRTLAQFAPVSLNPVLAKLDDKDPLVRMCALFVLQEMLLPGNYDKVKDPPQRSKIKRAFLKGARDPDPVVRSRAVQALAALGDTDVIPIIEDLARHDPAYLPGQADGGKDLYIVRKAAKEALAQLKSKRNLE